MIKMTLKALAALTVITMTSAANANELSDGPVPFEGYAPMSVVQYEKIIAILKKTKDSNGNPNYIPGEQSPDGQEYIQTLPIRQLAFSYAVDKRLLPTDCATMDCFDVRFRELNQVPPGTMSTTEFLNVYVEGVGLYIPTAAGQALPTAPIQLYQPQKDTAAAVAEAEANVETVLAAPQEQIEAEAPEWAAQLSMLAEQVRNDATLNRQERAELDKKIQRIAADLSGIAPEFEKMQTQLDGLDEQVNGENGLVATVNDLSQQVKTFLGFGLTKEKVDQINTNTSRVADLEKQAGRMTLLTWAALITAVVAVIIALVSLFVKYVVEGKKSILETEDDGQQSSTDAPEVRQAESSVGEEQVKSVVKTEVAKLGNTIAEALDARLSKISDELRAERSQPESPEAPITTKDVKVTLPATLKQRVRESAVGEFKNYAVEVDSQSTDIAIKKLDDAYCDIHGVNEIRGKVRIDNLPSVLTKAGKNGRIVGTNVRRLDTRHLAG